MDDHAELPAVRREVRAATPRQIGWTLTGLALLGVWSIARLVLPDPQDKTHLRDMFVGWAHYTVAETIAGVLAIVALWWSAALFLHRATRTRPAVRMVALMAGAVLVFLAALVGSAGFTVPVLFFSAISLPWLLIMALATAWLPANELDAARRRASQ
jgi:hypothetical protein